MAKCLFEESRDVKTIGITVRMGRIHLLYDSQFVASCKFDRLVRLLTREVNRLVLGHTLVAVPERSPGDDAETRGRSSTQCSRTTPGNAGTAVPKTPLRGQKKCSPVPKNSARAPKSLPVGEKKCPKGPTFGTASGEIGTEDPRKDGKSASIDDHGPAGESHAERQLNELAVRVTIRAAADALTSEERSALPSSIQKRLREIGCGDQPGIDTEAIPRLDRWRSEIRWQEILRRIVGGIPQIRPSFTRPPRRNPKLVGIVPGRVHRRGPPKATVVVDTSGSVSRRDLQEISAELEQMRHVCEITVVECDCEIQRIYPFQGAITAVRGRGGTDFRPPLEREFLSQHRPDIVIIFTDGVGPAHAAPPPIPVVWCLTEGGQKPVSWGVEIRMHPG
ncbi:MAG: hypothetical protein HYR85_23985 [Planctomycetes bacterium]|nr:hypothetical protein [Planctomycetota bacterium]